MSNTNNTLNSKRFVLRQSLVGKDTTIVVTFKNGNTVAYSHDKAFTIMQKALEAMPCWAKYKSYTASNNIPKVLRGTEAVISKVTVGGSPVQEKSFA